MAREAGARAIGNEIGAAERAAASGQGTARTSYIDTARSFWDKSQQPFVP